MADNARPIRRPRIKQTIEIIEAPDGSLHMMRATATDVRITSPSIEDRALLAALESGRLMEELEADFGQGVVQETLREMQGLGLVEDAEDYNEVPSEDRARFDRQLRYFSDVAKGSTTPADCHQRLADSSVAVLGVGGLGGRVALELACCGVGNLLLVDGDDVEVSNLNRQIQFSEADVGLPKVEQTASRIRAFNSSIHVQSVNARMQSQQDLAAMIQGADLVIDAADWPAHEIERWCNAACFSAGVPYIAMSHFPPIARVGPLYVPGETGCFECQLTRYRREYPLFDVAIEQRRGKASPAATLGPACGVIAGFVGMEALHFLTRLVEPPAKGVAYTYDLRTMTVETEAIIPEPSCPTCSPFRCETAQPPAPESKQVAV